LKLDEVDCHEKGSVWLCCALLGFAWLYLILFASAWLCWALVSSAWLCLALFALLLGSISPLSGVVTVAPRGNMTVWPSGLGRWLQAPVRKGVGSDPTAVTTLIGWGARGDHHHQRHHHRHHHQQMSLLGGGRRAGRVGHANTLPTLPGHSSGTLQTLSGLFPSVSQALPSGARAPSRRSPDTPQTLPRGSPRLPDTPPDTPQACSAITGGSRRVTARPPCPACSPSSSLRSHVLGRRRRARIE